MPASLALPQELTPGNAMDELGAVLLRLTLFKRH